MLRKVFQFKLTALKLLRYYYPTLYEILYLLPPLQLLFYDFYMYTIAVLHYISIGQCFNYSVFVNSNYKTFFLYYFHSLNSFLTVENF